MARGSFITRDERAVFAMLALAGHTDREIADMCGRDRSKVSMYRRRMGIPAVSRKPTSLPAAFVDDARVSPTPDLAKRYERSPRTIRRWRKGAGLEPVLPRRIIRQAKRTLWAKAPTFTDEQRAANVLRRHYPSVFRCDLRLTERGRETYGSIRGLPDNGRGHWFIAKVGIVNHATMIAKAREYGYEA